MYISLVSRKKVKNMTDIIPKKFILIYKKLFPDNFILGFFEKEFMMLNKDISIEKIINMKNIIIIIKIKYKSYKEININKKSFKFNNLNLIRIITNESYFI